MNWPLPVMYLVLEVTFLVPLTTFLFTGSLMTSVESTLWSTRILLVS